MLPAMAVIGVAIAFRRELRVELGRQLAAPYGLHLDDQIDQVVDRLLVCGEPHRMRAGERQAQSELRLREPAIELMPEQPARDRLRRLIQQEDALPRMNTSSSHICPSSSS
jgi:hypothetical protein